MTHQYDFNDKLIPVKANGGCEDAMQISNQVADLMRENFAKNTNVNIVVMGLPKDSMQSDEVAAKAKLFAAKPEAEDAISFKKDAEGNLIRTSWSDVQSKPGSFPKDDFSSKLVDTTSGASFHYKKDEYGNLIKAWDNNGGQKSAQIFSRLYNSSID